MNWRRLKITWIIWTINLHADSRAYCGGWVSVRTAVEASAGFGPWFRAKVKK